MDGYGNESKEPPNITAKGAEKRLRAFRKKAPQTYLARLERAVSQRLQPPANIQSLKHVSDCLSGCSLWTECGTMSTGCPKRSLK